MNRDCIVRSTVCKPLTAIGKHPKSVILAKQFQPHTPCAEPNLEIQNDFGGRIYDEKGDEIYFLAAIECFFKISHCISF